MTKRDPHRRWWGVVAGFALLAAGLGAAPLDVRATSPRPPVPVVATVATRITAAPVVQPVVRNEEEKPASRHPSGSSSKVRLEKVGESEHFEFYAENDHFPIPLEELKKEAESIFSHVSDRFGATMTERIRLSFREPRADPCGLRGFTKVDSPAIVVFANENTDRRQVWGVLAHEVGHAIHVFGMDADATGDIVLLEGVATWAAGRYWTAYHQSPSFAESVRGYIDTSTFMSIVRPDVNGLDGDVRTYLGEECRRDVFYTEWASFLDYLVDEHGMEKLRALWEQPQLASSDDEDAPARADYTGVYGKSLSTLQADWLRKVSEPEASQAQVDRFNSLRRWGIRR